MQQLNANYEFTIYSDLYSDNRTKDGKVTTKLIKRNVKTRLRVYIADIYLVEEVANPKGQIEKDKCSVLLKEVGKVIVNDPYSKIADMVFGKNKVVTKQMGFVNGSK